MKHIIIVVLLACLMVLAPFAYAAEPQQVPLCSFGRTVEIGGAEYTVEAGLAFECVVGRQVDVLVRGSISSGPAQVRAEILGQQSAWVDISYPTYVTVTINDLPLQGGQVPLSLFMRRAPGAPEHLIVETPINQDITPPTSAVIDPFPYSGKMLTFRWLGTDNNPPVEAYDIDVRVGAEGTWEPLYRNTIANEGTYVGENGQRVYFRSRAIDRYGNVEAWPADADQSTVFDALPPTGIVEISFIGVGSVQALIAADDNLSGVKSMRVGRRDTIENAPWTDYQSTATISRVGAPAGCLEVAVQLRDTVDNVSEIIYTPVPGTGCVTVNPNAVYLPMIRR